MSTAVTHHDILAVDPVCVYKVPIALCVGLEGEYGVNNTPERVEAHQFAQIYGAGSVT